LTASPDPGREAAALNELLKLESSHRKTQQHADELRDQLDDQYLRTVRILGGDVRTLAHAVGVRPQSVTAAIRRARAREGGADEMAGQISIDDLLAEADGPEPPVRLPAGVLASFPTPPTAAQTLVSQPSPQHRQGPGHDTGPTHSQGLGR
jgi:hypothetical protein